MNANVGGRDRFARGVLAVAFALVAVWAFRNGRRASGVAASMGALGFGFDAVTCETHGVSEEFEPGHWRVAFYCPDCGCELEVTLRDTHEWRDLGESC